MTDYIDYQLDENFSGMEAYTNDLQCLQYLEEAFMSGGEDGKKIVTLDEEWVCFEGSPISLELIMSGVKKVKVRIKRPKEISKDSFEKEFLNVFNPERLGDKQ